MIREFKEFIARGNVIDLAVGVIIGAAFGAITKSVVDDLVMPIIGMIVGNVDFANLFVTLSPGKLTAPAATLAEAKAAGAVTLNYGLFINVVINFFLIAFAVFLLVKFVNQMRKQMAGEKDAAAAPPPEDVELLREIRDELKRTRAYDPIVECVPNVSEGRDPAVIAALAAAVAATPGVRLLHVDSGVDAHRTVFTFVGPPEPVGDAAIALGREVAARIDMRRQHGAHPRLGALDVCPFVPVRATNLERCARLARRVGATLAHDLGLPVYLYEAAAFDPARRALPLLRRGEFEGLADRLRDPAFVPDFGPRLAHPTMGAAIVGARPFLIAWNLSLDTSDVDLARSIARRVRTSGQTTREGSELVRHPGLLPAVRAVGWGMPSYGHAQVSLNLLDFTVTPMHTAWRVVSEEAEAHGTRVIGSELIGLVPLEALRAAGRAAVDGGQVTDAALVAAAVRSLRLDAVGPFDPSRRVLEWVMADA